jgi:hypothetical protein
MGAQAPPARASPQALVAGERAHTAVRFDPGTTVPQSSPGMKHKRLDGSSGPRMVVRRSRRILTPRPLPPRKDFAVSSSSGVVAVFPDVRSTQSSVPVYPLGMTSPSG